MHRTKQEGLGDVGELSLIWFWFLGSFSEQASYLLSIVTDNTTKLCIITNGFSADGTDSPKRRDIRGEEGSHEA